MQLRESIQECNAKYRSFLAEAKDALTKGDRSKTEEMLIKAKHAADECAQIEEQDNSSVPQGGASATTPI